MQNLRNTIQLFVLKNGGGLMTKYLKHFWTEEKEEKMSPLRVATVLTWQPF